MFKKKIILYLLLPLLFIAAFAGNVQAKRNISKHTFSLHASGIRYLSKPDVKLYSGNKRFLTAPNTWGYEIGVGYEYKTKWKVSILPSISYGIQKNELSWKYTFTDFDPAVNYGNYSSAYVYKSTTSFLSTAFLLGYSFAPVKTKPLKIELQAGIGLITRFQGYYDEQNLFFI